MELRRGPEQDLLLIELYDWNKITAHELLGSQAAPVPSAHTLGAGGRVDFLPSLVCFGILALIFARLTARLDVALTPRGPRRAQTLSLSALGMEKLPSTPHSSHGSTWSPRNEAPVPYNGEL